MKKDVPNKSVGLGGCGFLGIYFIGAFKAFKEFRPEYLDRIAGVSCGSLIGAAYLSGDDLDDAIDIYIELAAIVQDYVCGILNPTFDNYAILRKIFEKLPADAHKKCNGRLFASVTRASDKKNFLLSEFDTREELIDALVCSTFYHFRPALIKLPTYRGVEYYDGCWSDNMPSIDENSVIICPFNGEADICPRHENALYYFCMNFNNMHAVWSLRNVYYCFNGVNYPLSNAEMNTMYYKGYKDAVHFLKMHDFQDPKMPIQLDYTEELNKDFLKCQTKKSQLMVDFADDRTQNIRYDLLFYLFTCFCLIFYLITG